MTRKLLVAFVLAGGALFAQDNALWRPLEFLIGTWEAKTSGGSAGAAASGTYSFQTELKGHVLARHSDNSGCKGPADFDCLHSDLLYIYPGAPYRAVYFDNEGHVIQYDVSTPSPTMVVFLSNGPKTEPAFRLIYELKGSTMFGKFQMRLPGQDEFRSYLEWSGGKAK
jgi:hypothetical protein